MGWTGMMVGRAQGGNGRDEMEDMLSEAYEKGRRDERREMEGRYGERGDYSRGDYESGHMDGDNYGERRGVPGTGPYSRYRRRY